MYRTRTCGDLRLADEGLVVTLAGWVQRSRKMGGMTFVDLRDRYGITQLVFNQEIDAQLCEKANKLGREYVIQVKGTVRERSSKNTHIPTGDIELIVSELNILNTAVTPPFTIEDETDGGDDLRMKYRYLDLRRSCVRKTWSCAIRWLSRYAITSTSKASSRWRRLYWSTRHLRAHAISWCLHA